VRIRVALVIAAVAVAVAAAAGKATSSGQGEGALHLLEWPSYSDASIARPFQRQTGCKIVRKDVGSSNQMAALMRNGGGKNYDLVSASGDIALSLVASHDVKPVDVASVPSEKDVFPALRSPRFNTVRGVHYGVAVQWVPNLLLYNTKSVTPVPASWRVIYSTAYKQKITLPNDPLQIADAALYLRKSRPSLGIRDPYELTKMQFGAAVALLQTQKPLVASYWNYAADEVASFKNGSAVVGLGWPYQALTLKTQKLPVATVIPREGITGFADSWMLAAAAPHPVCAKLWLRYVLTPSVQAKLAITLGETPVNPKACPLMNALQPGSCAAYHLDKAAAYLKRTTFWKTPLAACGWTAKQRCVPLVGWQKAWTQLRS